MQAYRTTEYEFQVYMRHQTYFKRLRFELFEVNLEKDKIALRNVDVLTSVEVIEHVEWPPTN